MLNDRRMNVSCVLFDLGMTLVRNPREALYQRVLKGFGIGKDIPELDRAFFLADKEFMRRYPHVLGSDPNHFMPWYLGVLNYYLHIRLDLRRAYEAFNQERVAGDYGWAPIPGALGALQFLKGMGLKVGVVSNWDPACRQLLRESGLFDLLDTVVVSSEVGFLKPDPEIFRIALRELDMTGEQALYVGDNYYDDVEGARMAGMEALLISPYGRLGIEETGHSPVIAGVWEVPGYIDPGQSEAAGEGGAQG